MTSAESVKDADQRVKFDLAISLVTALWLKYLLVLDHYSVASDFAAIMRKRGCSKDFQLTDAASFVTMLPELEALRSMWMFIHPNVRTVALRSWRFLYLKGEDATAIEIMKMAPVDLDYFIFCLEHADFYRRATKMKPQPPRVGFISDYAGPFHHSP